MARVNSMYKSPRYGAQPGGIFSNPKIPGINYFGDFISGGGPLRTTTQDVVASEVTPPAGRYFNTGIKDYGQQPYSGWVKSGDYWNPPNNPVTYGQRQEGVYYPRSAYYSPRESQYSMGVGTGITAGGRSVPGYGSSPLTGARSNAVPSGLDIVRQNYEAYLKNNELDKEALTLEQYMEARFNAFKAMGGSSNINYTNVDEYYRNFARELDRIMNPRTREEGGIQQSPAYGAGLVTSRF